MKKVFLSIASMITGFGIGFIIAHYFNNKTIRSRDEKISKYVSYYNILNQWFIIKQQGKKIDHYLDSQGYNTIAIYGMGEIGNRLYTELEGSNINVLYAIDKNASSTFAELEIFEINKDLPNVDVIIVTAVFDIAEIRKSLEKVIDCPIISFEDIVYEI
jgi:lactate dehydrogenase-like 2-hydroxyacid dehydrogenase